MTWYAHHAFVVSNAMDSTHVKTLHLRYHTRSFVYGPVTRCEAIGDEVIVGHDIEPSPSALLWHFSPRPTEGKQEVCYSYPHMWVKTAGIFKMYTYLLPVDARTTRVFMLPCSQKLTIPLTSIAPPKSLVRIGARLARAIMVEPTFYEDKLASESEQRGFDQNWDRPSVDPHPVTRLCHELAVRKWEEALRRDASLGAPRGRMVASVSASGASPSPAASV
jgi:hypothetical protein